MFLEPVVALKEWIIFSHLMTMVTSREIQCQTILTSSLRILRLSFNEAILGMSCHPKPKSKYGFSFIAGCL